MAKLTLLAYEGLLLNHLQKQTLIKVKQGRPY